MTVGFRRILFYGMVALPFLALALQIWSVASNWSWYQYDFRAYYTGPALYAAGEDPYSLEAHLALARDLGLGQQKLPFVYSPVMLQLLSPLAWFPYPVIYGIWLSAQVLALGAVIFLTMRALTVPLPHIAWMAAFGLNGTVAAVLRSGQMSLMVLAVLMLGVWALGAGRWRAATVLMTLAAVPKIWVLPLLSLIAVPLRLVRLLWMVGGVIVCLAIGMSGRWVFPELQLRYETIIADFLDFSGGPAGPYNGTITNILATLEELGYLPQETGPTIWLGIAAHGDLPVDHRDPRDGLRSVPAAGLASGGHGRACPDAHAVREPVPAADERRSARRQPAFSAMVLLELFRRSGGLDHLPDPAPVR